MPYLAFDLDALNAAPNVARGAGISEDAAIAGLARLWAWCFREEVDVVGHYQLAGFFGGGDSPRLGRALEAFGFLEASGDDWRVRGAERYLKIRQAQRAGGKRNAGNLKKGRNLPGNPEVDPEVTSECTSGSSPALSPNTEHRTPSTKTLPDAQESAPGEQSHLFAPPPVDPVSGMGGLALSLRANPEKRKRLRSVEPKPPDPRFQPLKEKLIVRIEAHTKGKYGWQPGDAAAIKRLISFGSDEEILRRLDNGLTATGYGHTSTICQLASKWNEPCVSSGDPPMRAGGARTVDIRKSPVRAEDVPKESFKQTGAVDGF